MELQGNPEHKVAVEQMDPQVLQVLSVWLDQLDQLEMLEPPEKMVTLDLEVYEVTVETKEHKVLVDKQVLKAKQDLKVLLVATVPQVYQGKMANTEARDQVAHKVSQELWDNMDQQERMDVTVLQEAKGHQEHEVLRENVELAPPTDLPDKTDHKVHLDHKVIPVQKEHLDDPDRMVPEENLE